jgi:histidine ammonia-lyase
MVFLDLSPLSYIAGTLTGNPSIRVFDGPAAFGGREIVSSCETLDAHGIAPIPLASKEHFGILNYFLSFSCSAGLERCHSSNVTLSGLYRDGH